MSHIEEGVAVSEPASRLATLPEGANTRSAGKPGLGAARACAAQRAQPGYRSSPQ